MGLRCAIGANGIGTRCSDDDGTRRKVKVFCYCDGGISRGQVGLDCEERTGRGGDGGFVESCNRCDHGGRELGDDCEI